MLVGLAADTSVITYLMVVMGVLGIAAKIINQITLSGLIKAAGNMPKSTQRLIKLVRAKYEHACMVHDSVENIEAFVDKYIYEYRGFLFRIHTWSQIEVLSVWFAGILAAFGASVIYFYSGFNESVYQYIASGVAEVLLLSVVIRLTDEEYKMKALKMYMVDYLENICVIRLKRQNQRDRESIDVISSEGKMKAAAYQNVQDDGERRLRKAAAYTASGKEYESDRNYREVPEVKKENTENTEDRSLSVNIEGEARNTGRRDNIGKNNRKSFQDSESEEERSAIKEETIRQILEEFLA